ncbi:PTS sugar transporter subunit IIA [Fusobacterium perfoetens]|uniref:PTS sugar transporter subunit IIA n=1 Tax=Fusobacterium perfoetens TaxID=852 RepID=UPI00047FF3DF|nr:PTS sugar transporter subunit IIA [Fusobacterium perfoetens]MCI6152966.1 PTS sugar transporter subunit IIA [Fusobacterium perfoetens]MDY3237186.1 PTS sugar transporter subunit IIA [Fusobacterium perfoetens]
MFENNINLRVEVVNSVNNWQEAIDIASSMLIKDKCVTKEYVEEIKENIETNGEKFLVDHDIFLAHSRPGNKVNKNALSFLKINEGTVFPNVKNKKIKLVFIISTLSSKQHMNWLKRFAKIMDDIELVTKLNNAQSKEEILEIFKNKI